MAYPALITKLFGTGADFAAGRLKTATPVGDGDAVNKAYLDDLRYDLCEFYFFRHPTLRPGFRACQGGLLTGAATLYPVAWDYLQTTAGQLLCKTETQWQAMSTAIWATLADGTTVGWNGIGGVPYFVQDLNAGTLRMPDIRGMTPEAAGFDSLDVAGVHGDGTRKIQGSWITGWANQFIPTISHSGVAYTPGSVSANMVNPISSSVSTQTYVAGIDSSRTTPTANKIQTRAWGALACAYLGQPAS
jgi:hypothetical protein